MYFEALKIFCDVVRHKSFSRAAAVNRISQSAVSQNVLQLEKSLGVRLIDRSKRPFQLTPEGQVYFEGCKGLVERYYAVEAEVKTLRNEVAGTVNVAAIYSVGLGDMSRLVQQFAHQYPRATVRLAYLHPDRVYEAVLNEQADVGLISYPRAGKDVVMLPWRTEPMVLVCPPTHRLARLPQVTAKDLIGEPFVAFDEGLMIRKMIDRQFRRHRVEVKITVAFDNVETIKRAVEIGEGVSILPLPTLRKDIQAGTLAAVPLTMPAMSRPLGIIHRRSGLLSRTVQRFIGFIQEHGNGAAAADAAPHAANAVHDGNDNGSPLASKVTV
ncbi:MAG: LysR family transcriptional regulator [Phycisphaerae bacterium]|jgi:DNA-binding transcriptional LysR family regulator